MKQMEVRSWDSPRKDFARPKMPSRRLALEANLDLWFTQQRSWLTVKSNSPRKGNILYFSIFWFRRTLPYFIGASVPPNQFLSKEYTGCFTIAFSAIENIVVCTYRVYFSTYRYLHNIINSDEVPYISSSLKILVFNNRESFLGL